jgi:membrane-bound lytic murein transglycosylase B
MAGGGTVVDHTRRAYPERRVDHARRADLGRRPPRILDADDTLAVLYTPRHAALVASPTAAPLPVPVRNALVLGVTAMVAAVLAGMGLNAFADTPSTARQAAKEDRIAADPPTRYAPDVRPPLQPSVVDAAAPVVPPSKPKSGSAPVTVSQLAANGIPSVALDAYRHAAAQLNPGCGITWPLLAGIGRVESDHGRAGGAVLTTAGTSTRKIIGPALNGRNGYPLIPSTDAGALEGDAQFAHAVGPMQFLPSTWSAYAVDGNADGVADPFNIYDAALAAAHYLCNSADLHMAAGRQRAVFAYNHSSTYVAQVLALAASYAGGATVVDTPAVTGEAAGSGNTAGRTTSEPTSASSPTAQPTSGASTPPSAPTTPPPTTEPTTGPVKSLVCLLTIILRLCPPTAP